MVITPALVIAVTTAFGPADAAPLSRPGPAAHGTSLGGTTAAKSGSDRRGTVKHAAASAQATATGDLSTVSAQTLHGGYTAAGIGMRNLGYGTISITGVPSGATVKSATLLWDILAVSADPTFAQGTFDGTAITGTAWASGASPCWPNTSSNFSYEADVTSLVTGNGAYNLAAFATGESDGADPWNVGSTPPNLEGASLVVVYQLASMPLVTVQIDEGASETDSGNSATATLSGFVAGSSPSVTTTYIVADGQYGDSAATFDGSTLPGVTFPGADPQAVPNYSLGNLWDTTNADVSSLVSPGDTSAALTVTGYDDCLVWVGQVLSATGGAVLALGDSVAAGYGLGPSEGFPDNAGAYSAVLAQALGLPVQNYAVEGACASSGDCSDKPSVAEQITQVPSGFTPSLVTLTVGADDIDFGDCIKAIFTQSDYSMTSATDPCNHAKLTTNLASFQNSLATDLATIRTAYPSATVLVMDYYNPFPPAPSGTGSPCLLDRVLAFPYEHHVLKKTWAAIAKQFVLHHSRFIDDARTVQRLLYADAQAVISLLNAAINAAATGMATVVPVSFAGHDICAHGTEWAFSPTAAAEIQAHVFSLHKTVHFGFGGDDICPDPVSSADWNLKIDDSFSIPHVSGQFTLAVGVNCLPHPTVSGQQAIASDFMQQAQ
jgi:lysophospholipase L1-like esterase